MTQDPKHYLLGHSDSELARLNAQGELYRDITLRAFRDAGIGEGMRVLDLGCGSGAVSRVAAEVVGPSGEVVGVDRSPDGVHMARELAAAAGLDQVRYVVTDIDDFEDAQGFDALVGRFVLMHQDDQSAALRAAMKPLRSGGIVVMIESCISLLVSGGHSEPFSPLYDEILQWKERVVRSAGADISAGLRLRKTFLDAGLHEPTTRVEASLHGGKNSPYYTYLAESLRSMLPEAQRNGITGFEEPDADSLADRLRDEVVASGGSLMIWPVGVAWARKE